jgi:hypothetical protein
VILRERARSFDRGNRLELRSAPQLDFGHPSGPSGADHRPSTASTVWQLQSASSPAAVRARDAKQSIPPLPTVAVTSSPTFGWFYMEDPEREASARRAPAHGDEVFGRQQPHGPDLEFADIRGASDIEHARQSRGEPTNQCATEAITARRGKSRGVPTINLANVVALSDDSRGMPTNPRTPVVVVWRDGVVAWRPINAQSSSR